MNLDEVETRLETLLRQAGCRRYSSAKARADAQEVWRDVRQDDAAHGQSSDEPFFTFVVAEGVGVFTFFGPSREIFVLPGDEQHFRNPFEPLATVEVRQALR